MTTKILFFFGGKCWPPIGIWNKKLISFETGWTFSLSFHGWNPWSNGGATKEHLDHLFRSQQHWHQQRSHQILENPQARFIGPPTDCGGVIQQTWASILNIAILLMAKIWTSFGWWFIYIYLTIFRVLYIPGAAFEPLIIIFVLPVHLHIQYSILLCLFILVEMTSFGQGNHGVITAHDTLRWSNPSMISSNKCGLNQSCPSYTHTCKPKHLYRFIIVLVPVPKSYSHQIINHVSNTLCLYTIHISYISYIMIIWLQKHHSFFSAFCLPGLSKVPRRSKNELSCHGCCWPGCQP